MKQVLGGNRFVVLIPSRLLLLRLAVLGLLPISPSDLYGRQATIYSVRRYLNRDVEFDVYEVDKSGGFLANIAIVGQSGDQIDIAKGLLLEGLAEVHKRTVKEIPNFDELVAAQEAAKAMNMGKWSNLAMDRVRLEFEQFYPLHVVDVLDSATVIVQFFQAAMKEIFVLLPSATAPLPDGELQNGTLVCAVIDGNRYRGKVEATSGTLVTVLLLDFDVLGEIDRNCLFGLPPRLISIEPQAITVTIAFIKDEQKLPEDKDYVTGITRDVEMFMNLVYAADLPAVLLLDKPTLETGSANIMIVQNTSVTLDQLDLELEDEYRPMVAKIKSVPRLKVTAQ